MSTVNEVFSPVTITNYGKRIVDGITQKNPFWKILKSKGKIERNVGGDAFTWNLEAGRHDVHITSDDQDVSDLYTPRKRWQRPQLDWGQISSFRRFGKGILRQNTGKEALVKVRDREIPAMYRDAIFNTNGLHYQILNTAGASYTGNGLPIYGLPSLFTGVTWSDSLKEGVIGTGATYAGINLSLSGLVGTVDGAERDAWTPTAINTTASVWSGGTGAQTFRDNVFEILTYGLTRTDRFSSNDSSMRASLILLTQAMFTDLGTKIEGKQTYFIQNKVGEDDEQGLGSNTDILYHGGRKVTWDENLPADTGYILIMDMLGMMMQPKAEWGKVAGNGGLSVDGEDSDWFELDLDFNTARRSLLAAITLAGQFQIGSPRGVTQLYAGA
jgi:hypothetical protein